MTLAQTQVAALKGLATDASSTSEGVQVQQGITTSSLEIVVNGAITLESGSQFSELSIANPEIADISTLTDRTIYVMGKNPGRTTLMLFSAQGQVSSIVTITVAPDITEFKERLALILPDENIRAFTANDGIVIAGAVSSQTAIDQAIALANRYARGRISNLMTLEVVEATGIDLTALRMELATLLPGVSIDVRQDGNSVILNGTVADAALIALATDTANGYAPGNVSNQMTVEAPYVAPDADVLAGKLHQILTDEAIGVHTVGTSVVLSGSVSSAEKMAQAVQLAQLFAPQSDISNLMSVEAVENCFIRTRRGAEVVTTTIPCSD
jgi:Flp pilus assembly secretin CpaC